MVPHADGRDRWPIEELKDVHGDKHLGDDDEHIALGDNLRASKWRVECGVHERHIDKRVGSNDQDQDFDSPGNVVIDETPSSSIIHVGIDFAIRHLEKETLKNVEADQEINDTNDAQYKTAKGS